MRGELQVVILGLRSRVFCCCVYNSIGDRHRGLGVKRIIIVNVSYDRQEDTQKKQEPYYKLLQIILVVTSSHSLCNARPKDILNSYYYVRGLFGGI